MRLPYTRLELIRAAASFAGLGSSVPGTETVAVRAIAQILVILCAQRPHRPIPGRGVASAPTAAAPRFRSTASPGHDGPVSRGTKYEPETAQRAVRELAAVTDEQLAGEIRTAAALVLARVDELTASGRWPRHAQEQLTHAALRRASDEFTALPADADAADVQGAAAPILAVYWPNSPAIMQPTHEAIEELRRVAMHRWSLVRDARLIIAGDVPQ
jgi:hypothetical protein